MSRVIFDCLKSERDICVKTIIPRRNTSFRCPPALNEPAPGEQASWPLLLFIKAGFETKFFLIPVASCSRGGLNDCHEHPFFVCSSFKMHLSP